MEITACLFINSDDCTSLRWVKEEDFNDFLQSNPGWIYIGMFDIEAGKINSAFICDKNWERRGVKDD